VIRQIFDDLFINRADMNYSGSCSDCTLPCLFPIGISTGVHFLNIQASSIALTSYPIAARPYSEHVWCGVTEPFLVHEEDDKWYLFARWTADSPSKKGEIVMFTSLDRLKTFVRGQVILREPWSLGRPFVFADGNWHYMLTNVEDALQGPKFLWLYESGPGDWPFRWGRRGRILYEESLHGRPLNPVLFRHAKDSTWYLIVLDEGLGTERVYFSDRVDAGFIEHPLSRRVPWQVHTGPLVVDEDDPNRSIWAFLRVRGENAGSYAIVSRRIVELSPTDFRYSSSNVPVDWSQPRTETFSAHLIGIRQWLVMSDGWFDGAAQKLVQYCDQRMSCNSEGQFAVNDIANATNISIVSRVSGENIQPRLEGPRVSYGVTKSFYINLEHRLDRRLMIEGVLGSSSIPFERIQAVDGRNKENSHLLVGCYDNKYCPGHVGCQHSHLKAIQAAIDSELDYVAIFEDDFMFKPAVDLRWVHSAVQQVMDLVPDWDFIGLLHNIQQKEPMSDVQVKWSEVFSTKLVRILEAATATGYIARRTILPALLDTMHPTKCNVTRDQSIAIDQCWKNLQKQFTWIGFEPQV
jgi:GR25 family glycosyltransferase involved in LPS biosynthesis